MGSKSELLAQNAFVEAVAGIEQQIDRNVMVHLDIDAAHRTHLIGIGDRGHRPFVGILRLDGDLGLVGQQRAAPAPRPERADRREREQRRVDRDDRTCTDRL